MPAWVGLVHGAATPPFGKGIKRNYTRLTPSLRHAGFTSPAGSMEGRLGGAVATPGTDDARFAAKVRHLQATFAEAPEDEIAAALVRTENSPLAAKQVRPDCCPILHIIDDMDRSGS